MAIGSGPISAKRATAAEWTAEDPVLAAGERGYERDTGKVKIGDGSTAWSAITYIGAAVTNCVPAADGTSAGTQLNALLASLRAANIIA
ncbi:hypothetical protein [Streptomyces albipurpureus]|uniref:Major tropism determinant N-terminal domain-containing protein n=1 Tax=Streptomyces albipurpureus TaxID=2897419 RepID=A0ABT0UQB5_9ACTN|nr:hypothetical protein [Streptomyces sp. CWNU-1]MCM2390189.1 hypothetical protein [Streptomyces sp. CWNU-1]